MKTPLSHLLTMVFILSNKCEHSVVNF